MSRPPFYVRVDQLVGEWHLVYDQVCHFLFNWDGRAYTVVSQELGDDSIVKIHVVFGECDHQLILRLDARTCELLVTTIASATIHVMLPLSQEQHNLVRGQMLKICLNTMEED